MKKKMLMVLLGASMVLSPLTAFADGEKTKVTFYMWAADAEQEFDRAIVAQYEEEHPDIDIEENYIPYAEYLSKINTMAAAGSMPDIFNLPEGNVFEWGKKEHFLI